MDMFVDDSVTGVNVGDHGHVMFDSVTGVNVGDHGHVCG